MKILIIAPSWVGDLLMSQSLYKTLKQNHPSLILDVFAPSWCFPLLKKMPEVDHAIEMPIGHGKLVFFERKKIAKKLQENNYDQAIVLPNSFKSALIPFFAKIPKRTGWLGEFRFGLLNDLRKLDKKSFPRMVERYVALAFHKSDLRAQNAKNLIILPPKLNVNSAQTQYVFQKFFLDENANYIGFCPGAEFGMIKCWPDFHFTELAKKLIEKNYQILLFGSKNDEKIADKILVNLNENEKQFCVNLCGKTKLEEVVDLIAGTKAMVSNDSGLMHVAAALNKPLIALYGPSSPEFTPPLSENSRVIRLIDGYFLSKKDKNKPNYHQSLIDISPERVLLELEKLLN